MVASRARFFLLVGTLLAGSVCQAAGYEKSIMFGGKSAGLAGIATPYTTGGEALYFNPAGLQNDKVGSDVSLYVSPSWNPNKGPFDNNNDTVTSESRMVTPAGLFYGYTPNSTWGFGAGFFTAGGSSIAFNNLAYTTPAGTTLANKALSASEVNSNLRLNEFSVGAGYKVNDQLKVGLAWRYDMATANFAFAQRYPLSAASAATTMGDALVNAEVNGIKATSLQGLRFGAQYKLSDSTALGLTYRSPVVIRGNGTFAGKVRLPTAAGGDKDIVNNSVNVGTEFPQQVLLGVQQKLTDTWMLYGQYSWTNYAKIDHITLDGTFKYTGGTATAASDLDQKWHDQHLIQVAAGYTGFFMPIYFGAEYVTAVTDKDHARLTSSPPGGGYELTLGSEYKIMENMSLSGAFEYYDLSGSANGGAAGTGTSDFREGTYTAIGYAFHLGAKYSF